MPRSHSPTPSSLAPSRTAPRERELDRRLTRNLARVLARVRTMLGDGARREAESCDHVHDALVEVLRENGRVEIDDEEQLVRRMSAMARNNIRDAARRRREQGFDSLASTWVVASPSSSPHSHVSRREQVQALMSALRELPAGDRRVVELRAFEHLRFTEIARRLGRHEDTVRKAYHRALLVLSRRVAL